MPGVPEKVEAISTTVYELWNGWLMGKKPAITEEPEQTQSGEVNTFTPDLVECPNVVLTEEEVGDMICMYLNRWHELVEQDGDELIVKAFRALVKYARQFDIRFLPEVCPNGTRI